MTIPEAFELALGHHRAGRLADAEALYRQILAAQPRHADSLHLLGVIAHQAGHDDLAVEWIRQAIAIDPTNPAAHSNLGEAYLAMGRPDEAIVSYRRALSLKPDYPEACNNLGNALREQCQFTEAIAACRQAIALRPDFPEAHNNLGAALAGQGRLDEAMAAYHRALHFKPDFAEAHNNLGHALRESGQLAEAIAACRRAVALKPGFTEAHNNLGVSLAGYGQLDEAMAAYHRALALQPDFPETLNNLGNALKDQGKLDDALAAYRRALQIKPTDAGTHSNLIYALHFHPDHDATAISAEQRRWSQQFSEPLKQSILPHGNDPAVAGPLRIGYVSPDFRDHVVGRNLAPLFHCHDRERFEILCYSGVVSPDSMTGEFRQRAHEWRNTLGVGDDALAEMIRQDKIDILVDLTQHLAGNRLPMFARRPAPVQVSFAGYPESAGLDAIGHRISDRFLEPHAADERPGAKEQIHFIDSFWCYDPCGVEIEVSELPASKSLGVTFGCLNNFCKINEPGLCLWAKALGMVKHSRLVMQSAAGSHRERTLEILEREGIASHRVEFVEYRPRWEYLQTYHRLDIALDTTPYNGHTTSLDALWMGVPVVTLAGQTPVSRAGLSQLTNLGLPELVAHTPEDYVKIAVDLATDLPRLEKLRATLRKRMQNSILMDAPCFARQIEAAYQKMWQAGGKSMRDEV